MTTEAIPRKGTEMMTLDTIVGRLLELETKYFELQELYHHLINEYEKLKEEHERNQQGTRYDPWNTKT